MGKGLERLKEGLAKSKVDMTKKSALFLKSADEIQPVQRLSSGSLVADYILGGGWAVGRINEVCGVYSSGKSTLSLMTIVEAQRKGQSCIYIDAEGAFDNKYAAVLGVDFNPEKLAILDSNNGEFIKAIILEALQDSEENNLGLIVIDSVSAVVPTDAHTRGEETDAIAQNARFWSEFCRVLANLCREKNVTCIVVNQTRVKFDFQGNKKYAAIEDKIEVTGGNSLKFYKSLSLYMETRAKESDKEALSEISDDKVTHSYGNKIYMKTIKNKTADPFVYGHAFIRYGQGFDNLHSAIPIFIKKNLIEQDGSVYKFANLKGEETKIKSVEKLYVPLKKDPDLCGKWLESLGFALCGDNYFRK